MVCNVAKLTCNGLKNRHFDHIQHIQADDSFGQLNYRFFN
jgi:hypothetical protein